MMSPFSKTHQGITLTQMNGPHVEASFDFAKLPPLDLQKEHYEILLTPQSKRLPTERIRLNSAGPLFLYLQEGQKYQVGLIRQPKLAYEVQTRLEPLPHVDLIEEHPLLLRLNWGNMDLETIQDEHGAQRVELFSEEGKIAEQNLYDQPFLRLPLRPKELHLKLPNGETLFEVYTNLNEGEEVAHFTFEMPPAKLRLHGYAARQPERGFKVRAEMPRFLDMDLAIKTLIQERTELDPKEALVGFVFEEPKRGRFMVRQWGQQARINSKVIAEIQTRELGLAKAQHPKSIIAEIQITTAHRELFKECLFRKELKSPKDDHLIRFADTEVQAAKERLFELSPHAEWDHAFVEMVFFFTVKEEPPFEFQRETLFTSRWDYHPALENEHVGISLEAYHPDHPTKSYTLIDFGKVYKDLYPAKVVLKPYSSHQLLAWWDLEPDQTGRFLHQEWGVGLEEVGFYLKVHEEYHGKRMDRPDLEVHLTDLFSGHQSHYLDVEANHCYSAEIVARHHHMERALTPVSPPITTPRGKDDIPQGLANHRHNSKSWHHPSQRRVHHLVGHDGENKAKVLLHLHMHSPNLFRAEPFREGFLKPQTWPFTTPWGAEVHNPPGEWALKNCLDSWLPILQCFENLIQDGVDFQVSLDISPPVAYMISHPRFKDHFSRYLSRSVTHAESQLALMKARLENPDFVWSAQKYLDWLKGLQFYYEHHLQKDIIGAYRRLELSGHLELSTCTATHGMAANLESMPNALKAQLSIAARAHHRIFGDRPKGIWLAENSVFPGVAQFLAEEDLNYYFVEAEAALQGSVGVREEEFNPQLNPGTEVVSFGRSRMGRVQVWDAEIGYAGHPEFREYHHRHWGLPLKKITSKTSEVKGPYNPDRGRRVAQELAQDFYDKLAGKAQELAERPMAAMPLITCSYDAELFGHHWFEGPWFLEELLREFDRKSSLIGLTTPSHYLADHRDLPEVMPNPSTWGHDACHVRWNDAKVNWTQRELERADGLLTHYLGLALEGRLNNFHKDCVRQMAAELLRAESSDLTFVIMSGDFEEDMQREILKFLDYFYRLKALIDAHEEDETFLNFRRYENDMFPELHDYYRI